MYIFSEYVRSKLIVLIPEQMFGLKKKYISKTVDNFISILRTFSFCLMFKTIVKQMEKRVKLSIN